jgi:hypothetical protein
VDNQSCPLVDNLPNVCSNCIRHAGLERICTVQSACVCHNHGLAVSRRQFKCSPHSTPDDLARYAVRQRLNNGALAESGEAVFRGPHPEVTRTEVELQALPKLGLLHSRHCAWAMVRASEIAPPHGARLARRCPG